MKIIPINFNLKTQMEKEAILNSYKIFLKTCNFDIQILIQSKKEDLSNHIKNIKKNSQKEKSKIIKKYIEKYNEFIQEKNNKNKAATKNIFLIIKNNELKTNNQQNEENIIQELDEKYFKIKESLNRCGNTVIELSKDESKNVIFSFLNSKKYYNK